MATLGIELCDAAFRAATFDGQEVKLIATPEQPAGLSWPGFAYFDGQKFAYGPAAEDLWFVHPRRVAHTFWSRLAQEPSTLGPSGKPAPFSQLAFHFFQDFYRHATRHHPADKVVLAVPGAYLKDPATEEEKIGLLLGIAGELKLPLSGVVDLACAALCDPRSSGFNPTRPVLVVDLHLDGTDLTLITAHEHIARQAFMHLPQSGGAQLLKHLTSTLGNRFLRQTAFDILEDGRIEQLFFRQTKDFFLSGASEHRFQINTANRTYEMIAKRDQLVGDAQAFVHALVQNVQAFERNTPHCAMGCTIALMDRAAQLPGLEARLRAAGYPTIIRLAPGAAASGAAHIGASRKNPPPALSEVPVETALPLTFARLNAGTSWEARLHKVRASGDPRPSPTHVILEGIGHPLAPLGRSVIGTAQANVDVPLPDPFNQTEGLAIQLVREGPRLWLISNQTTPIDGANSGGRTLIEAGDRLALQTRSALAELLFVACGAPRPAGPA